MGDDDSWIVTLTSWDTHELGHSRAVYDSILTTLGPHFSHQAFRHSIQLANLVWHRWATSGVYQQFRQFVGHITTHSSGTTSHPAVVCGAQPPNMIHNLEVRYVTMIVFVCYNDHQLIKVLSTFGLHATDGHRIFLSSFASSDGA